MIEFMLLTALLALVITPRILSSAAVANRGDVRHARLVSRIDSLLPQTQCRECGYAGCRPYAEAIARGQVDIHRCPPGGADTVRQLEQLLGHSKSHSAAIAEAAPAHTIAYIDEALCIGCVKCVRACPVDAILGAAGHMHSIIPAACTGCGLCIEPCPVDCITLVCATGRPQWQWPRPESNTPVAA